MPGFPPTRGRRCPVWLATGSVPVVPSAALVPLLAQEVPVTAPHDPLPQSLHVAPPLGPRERTVLRALAGHPTDDGRAEVVRIWRGQPRCRSPWLPCAAGCCLVPAADPVGDQRGAWLRFLLREVLAPRSAGAQARCARLDLGGPHRMHGTVVIETAGQAAHWISVTGDRVRERPGARGTPGSPAVPAGPPRPPRPPGPG